MSEASTNTSLLPQRPAPKAALNSSTGESSAPASSKIRRSGARPGSKGAYARPPSRTVKVRQSVPRGRVRVSISIATRSRIVSPARRHTSWTIAAAVRPRPSTRAKS